MYDNTLSDRIGRIGVAMGLAWTSFGGEVLVVEASKMSGNGDLVLTGQLGDVMKESATIALSWIRSHSEYVTIISIRNKSFKVKICLRYKHYHCIFRSLEFQRILQRT